MPGLYVVLTILFFILGVDLALLRNKIRIALYIKTFEKDTKIYLEYYEHIREIILSKDIEIEELYDKLCETYSERNVERYSNKMVLFFSGRGDIMFETGEQLRMEIMKYGNALLKKYETIKDFVDESYENENIAKVKEVIFEVRRIKWDLNEKFMW